jgi:hypothetical protein
VSSYAVQNLSRLPWVRFHHRLGTGQGRAHRRIPLARRHRQQQQTKAWESYPFHFSKFSFGVLSFVGKDTATFSNHQKKEKRRPARCMPTFFWFSLALGQGLVPTLSEV